jgi:hypothetical protein
MLSNAIISLNRSVTRVSLLRIRRTGIHAGELVCSLSRLHIEGDAGQQFVEVKWFRQAFGRSQPEQRHAVTRRGGYHNDRYHRLVSRAHMFDSVQHHAI